MVFHHYSVRKKNALSKCMHYVHIRFQPFVSGSVVIFGSKFVHQSLVTDQSVMQPVKLTDDKYR